MSQASPFEPGATGQSGLVPSTVKKPFSANPQNGLVLGVRSQGFVHNQRGLFVASCRVRKLLYDHAYQGEAAFSQIPSHSHRVTKLSRTPLTRHKCWHVENTLTRLCKGSAGWHLRLDNACAAPLQRQCLSRCEAGTGTFQIDLGWKAGASMCHEIEIGIKVPKPYQ